MPLPENSYDSYEGGAGASGSSPAKHYSVDDDGVIWKKGGGNSSVAAVRPVMSSTMRYSWVTGDLEGGAVNLGVSTILS